MRRRTPLHDVHVALGATMTAFAGWAMPVRYASDLAEHRAVRTRAGLFDLSHMGEFVVHGPEAAAALDRALVGALSAVAVGRATYTMLCVPDGGVVDDLIVYRRGEDEFLAVANAANAATVATELRERCAGFAATVVDQSEQTALLALQGPVAADVLRTLGVEGLDDLRSYAGMSAVVAGTEVFLARTGYTGEDGFELFVDAAQAAMVWRTLSDAGRPEGVIPAGLACRDTLRLEAGMPLYGHELSRDRTPFEAGLGRVVALDHARDFVGRRALEDRARTGPPERLVGLVASGRRAPRAGYQVRRARSDGSEETVGEVTSGAWSPTLEVPIAMAYVRPDAADVGTDLLVDLRGSVLPVEAVALPFYRRSR